MINFANFIDLPFIAALILALAIFMYVLLDGFDLGIGILFPFAPSRDCQTKMVNSIAPFWDGNETWLVLGGGGLLCAFPLAYSIIMPAFYIPIILMLIGLILRGIAFEFRFKSEEKSRFIWDYTFHFGSLIAGFFQGIILGGFIQGIKVENKIFVGGNFDWLNAFSITTAIALLFGYCLLGSTWLIMKTEGLTQKWARQNAIYLLCYVIFFIAVVTLWAPFLNDHISKAWFSFPNLWYLLPIALTSIVAIIGLLTAIHKGYEARPFILTIILFFCCYLGLGITLWPWIVPYQLLIWEAAAPNTSLTLLLIGIVIFLPIILIYTAYSYYVFRGKVGHESLY
jgi:cytochrome d ubiquinol oxidase subunit II